MKTFSGKVAAVTGAGSGIGRALAVQLAQQGCHLALCDLNAEHLEQTAKMCAAQGQVAVTTQSVDVANRDAVHQWAAQVVADHGKVNLIFNNAGVALGSLIEEMDYKDLDWIMGVNFWGVVHGTMAFLPYLRKSDEGHVVNISSAFGLLSMPGQSGYNASKFAVRGFTESLRMELDMRQANVSATSVHPGGIKTGIATSARIRENLGMLVNGSSESMRNTFESRLITTPEKTAAIILEAVRKKKRRVLIGVDAIWMDRLVRFVPAQYQLVIERIISRAGRKNRGEVAGLLGSKA